jgi:hypothetical protein
MHQPRLHLKNFKRQSISVLMCMYIFLGTFFFNSPQKDVLGNNKQTLGVALSQAKREQMGSNKRS